MEQLLDQQRAQNKRELAKAITAALKAQEAWIYEEIRQQFITEHLPLVDRDLRRELAPYVLRELRIENSNPTNWDTEELQASPSSARRATNSRTERTPSMERGGRLPRHHSTSCMQVTPSSYITPDSGVLESGQWWDDHGPDVHYHLNPGEDDYEYGQWRDENKRELFGRNSEESSGEQLEWQETTKGNYDGARDLEGGLGWAYSE